MQLNVIQTMLEARKALVIMINDDLLADVSRYELVMRLEVLDNKIRLEQLYNLPSFIH